MLTEQQQLIAYYTQADAERFSDQEYSPFLYTHTIKLFRIFAQMSDMLASSIDNELSKDFLHDAQLLCMDAIDSGSVHFQTSLKQSNSGLNIRAFSPLLDGTVHRQEISIYGNFFEENGRLIKKLGQPVGRDYKHFRIRHRVPMEDFISGEKGLLDDNDLVTLIDVGPYGGVRLMMLAYAQQSAPYLGRKIYLPYERLQLSELLESEMMHHWREYYKKLKSDFNEGF